MDDAAWLTLNVYQESAVEPTDGKAAVALVTLNRAHRRPPYFSDGSIKGTVLWPGQFSWCEFEMVGGKYQRVAHTREEVLDRAARLYDRAKAHKLTWAACADAAEAVLAGHYVGGAEYDKLGSEALLYANLAILPKQPAWATDDKLIAKIGHHTFFRQ